GHIAAVKVCRVNGFDRGSPGDELAGGPASGRRESLVGRGGSAGRAIDHIEPEVIEIRDLVHWLGDGEAKYAVLWLKLPVRDRNGLVAVGLAVDAGCYQVTQSATAEQIANAHESAAVPGEDDRAASSLAIVLSEIDSLIRTDV